MNRRRFASALSTVVLAGPFIAGSQHAESPYRIGWLGTVPVQAQEEARPGARVLWEAFIQGLREHGWVEHKNIVFAQRYSGADIARYPRLAAELAALKPAVIATALGEPAVRALKTATTTIPIVMVVSADPVGTGLVASLARPGGNVTGLSILAPDAAGKRVELLRETLPKVSRLAVLWNRAYPGKAVEFEETQRAARALSIALSSTPVRAGADFNSAFVEIARTKPHALLTLSDPLTLENQRRIVAFATEHRLPLISEIAEFAEAGGLMTYGASLPALFHRAAYYVDISKHVGRVNRESMVVGQLAA